MNHSITKPAFALTGNNFAQNKTGTAIATTTSVDTNSTGSVQSGSSDGLDTGAKVGIGVGVGVAVGVLLILGALVFYFRRRRSAPKNTEGGSAEGPHSDASHNSISEMRGNGLANGSHLQHELHNPTDRPELLGSYAYTGELPDTSKTIPQEMDATADHIVRNIHDPKKYHVVRYAG
ncbi:hypothetical protein N7450_009896 [Penicillium hetheringtonii]|uniref:Uncharacterized protein n=1 Tax=Penicillium hetheringtonii TaxID=911720 RepID=A0AAD6DC54_9EURO|nr:hypothetical protein N7450_009896 [Penicillium hetheringtonii]